MMPGNIEEPDADSEYDACELPDADVKVSTVVHVFTYCLVKLSCVKSRVRGICVEPTPLKSEHHGDLSDDYIGGVADALLGLTPVITGGTLHWVRTAEEALRLTRMKRRWCINIANEVQCATKPTLFVGMKEVLELPGVSMTPVVTRMLKLEVIMLGFCFDASSGLEDLEVLYANLPGPSQVRVIMIIVTRGYHIQVRREDHSSR